MVIVPIKPMQPWLFAIIMVVNNNKILVTMLLWCVEAAGVTLVAVSIDIEAI